MFDGVNQLIRNCYLRGYSEGIYQGIVYAAFAVQFFYLIIYRDEYRVSLKKALCTVVLVYPVLYFAMLTITWAERGFQGWGANNIVRLYPWVPLLVIPMAKLLKFRPTELDDYIAPSMALQQFLGHSVCPFRGCCQGYPCEWGIYNPKLHTRLFPNQWLECLVALVIFILLRIYARREGHTGQGKVFSLFLILYGSTRFLLEFLRDNEKLFWGISELALHALLGCVIGCVWLALIRKKEKAAAEALLS